MLLNKKINLSTCDLNKEQINKLIKLRITSNDIVSCIIRRNDLSKSHVKLILETYKDNWVQDYIRNKFKIN